MRRPPDDKVPGQGAPRDSATHQGDPHNDDQVTTDRSGHDPAGCMICDLVADTHRQLKARIAQRDLVQCVAPARTLDIAGPHKAATP